MKILLIVYDNGSFVHYFPIGTAYIASSLLNMGYEVDIWNQDIHHYPDSYLKNFLERGKYDAVGLGFVGNYYTFKKAQKIAQAVNSATPRPHFFLGGHGPSANPEYFKYKMGADAVAVGEGEHSVLEAIYKNGIFKSELIKDIDSIQWPAYKKFPLWYYRLRQLPHSEPTDFSMPILSTRGCIYKCNFCFRMDEGIRLRAIDAVIEEIKYLKKRYRINYIDFADELTTITDNRTAELCAKIAPLKMKWMCNGRLNLVNPHILKTMRLSGCRFINYGIEAMDDEVLKTMNKKLTVEQIHAGIDATLRAGISPGFNIIIGHIGDTKESINRGMEFILKHDDGAQRRTMLPVTPYPGSELFNEAIKRGLIKDIDDFYSKHKNSDLITCNFTELPNEELYQCLLDANTALLANHYRLQLQRSMKQLTDLYVNKNANFRGFR